MKKRILILLGILIIGGGAAGACWKMGVFGQQETSGDAVYVTKISDLTGQTTGVSNRYAGVVEPQETVSVGLESGRNVKKVEVKTGDQVKKGQLLFEYDLSSIEENLEEAQLELDRLKNEASSLNEQIATLEKEKRIAASALRSLPTPYMYQTDALADQKFMSLPCPACGKRTAFDTPWFDSGREKYMAISVCPQHGFVFGQMHFKRTPSNTLIMHQRAYPASREDVEDVRERYRLYLLTPPKKRHHRLNMEEVVEKAAEKTKG